VAKANTREGRTSAGEGLRHEGLRGYLGVSLRGPLTPHTLDSLRRVPSQVARALSSTRLHRRLARNTSLTPPHSLVEVLGASEP
jgi:hypothetical protein